MPAGRVVRILFLTTKLEKVCSESKKAVQAYGDRNGKLLMRRLGELRAADRLEDKPEAPAPTKEDGGLDWRRVECVIICRVEDTHD